MGKYQVHQGQVKQGRVVSAGRSGLGRRVPDSWRASSRDPGKRIKD